MTMKIGRPVIILLPLIGCQSSSGFNSYFYLCIDDSCDESEDIDDALLKELSEGLYDLELAEKFSHSPLPDERNFKPKKKNISKTTSEFHLDEWISLKMETNAAHHLFAVRQKWQVGLLSCFMSTTNTSKLHLHYLSCRPYLLAGCETLLAPNWKVTNKY